MLFEPTFLRAFLIPVGLHMIWNSPLPSPLYLKQLVLGGVGWFVLFGLVQQGLRQVKAEQRDATRRQLESTRTLSRTLEVG
jgi:RsiW-degrading membrane proteinase PrsW (M82 family)